MINLFFFIFIQLQAAVTVEDIPQSYDEWDSYPLVEVLIQDGQLDLAEKLLLELSDSVKNHFYLAKIDIKRNHQSLAIEKLLSISTQPQLYNQVQKDLAQAYAGSNQFEHCVKSFEKVHELNFIENRLYAQCSEKAKNYDQTYLLLSKFRDEKTVIQKIQLLKKMNLMIEARNSALEFIKSKPPLVQVMNIQQLFPDNEIVLETLRLIYPNSHEVINLWSHHQYKKGFTQLAANGYEQAAWLGMSDSFLASAELWRSIGYYKKSESLSSLVSDESQKLRLQLSLALDEENYAKFSGLSGAFSRSQLSHDQDLLYAFFYSYYQMRDFIKASFYKAQITRSDLLEKMNRIEFNK